MANGAAAAFGEPSSSLTAAVSSADCFTTYSGTAKTLTPPPTADDCGPSASLSCRRRNRPSRWQPANGNAGEPASLSMAASHSGHSGGYGPRPGSTSRLPVAPTSSSNIANGQPTSGHSLPSSATDSINSLPFLFPGLDSLKGVDLNALGLAGNTLTPIFAPKSTPPNPATALEMLLKAQQTLPGSNAFLQPPPSINCQLPGLFGGGLRSDPNMTAILQRLLVGGGVSLPPNLIPPTSTLPPTSSSSSSVNNGSIPSSAASTSQPFVHFALPNNGLNNLNGTGLLNLLFNGVPLGEILNGTSSSSSSGCNMLGPTGLPVFLPPNFAANSLGLNLAQPPNMNLNSNINGLNNLKNALPSLNNQIALMTHFLNQQNQQGPQNQLKSQAQPNFFGSLTNLVRPPLFNSHADSAIPPPLLEVSAQHLSQFQTNSGMGSPMDIEDDEDEPTSSSLKQSSTAGDHKKHVSPSSTTRKDRSETTRIADAAMKAALKPYFTKRMVSKDEYKEIMKKGVAKLRDKDELKPDKVEKFVRRYVELIAKRRTK